MSYLGYRVKIGNTIIYSNIIAPGSYSLTKNERVIYKWKDANEVEHHDVSGNPKVQITFSIRDRSMTEQASIAGIFSSYKNLSVTYWDDVAADYVTGTFYMTPPTFTHHNAQAGSIMYDPTQITLTEY